MVGIEGIGGPQAPRPNRSSGVRDNRPSPSADQESASDGVVISSEAQAAAALTKTLQAGVDDVRAARVEAARQAIERGDYRRPDVVKVVAEKISRLL
jgi:flagellar biosynthesis anti-sigma factor FlgM